MSAGTDVEVVERRSDVDAMVFLAELTRPRRARHVLVRDPRIEVDDDACAALVAGCRAAMAASASPLPVPAAAADRLTVLPVDGRLPPAPTIAIGCPEVCVLSTEALQTVRFDVDERAPGAVGATDALTWLLQQLSELGWRHVAAPGVGFGWSLGSSVLPVGTGAWSQEMLRELHGRANPGLETHVLWAETRLRPVQVIIDGACLTDSPHNGSQLVVVEIARALRRARPDARVTLAVGEAHVASIRREVGAAGVEVVERDGDASGFDVVLRPYQLLDPSELEWLVGAGRRIVVSQLDMIAFSNPSYHPSPALFHAVRNLQRHTMRIADGVTFISHFGLRTALAECPDLEPDRCSVVGCGVPQEPSQPGRPSGVPPMADDERLVVCLSATFRHKHRPHAIAVFAELCRRHGYEGSLVIAGPEPYYGRSAEAEDRLLATLDDDVRRRVVRLGQIDEPTKWWLLDRADLVLYPSIVEGFGLVPFEAAAVGTPSLSHAGSAIAEVLGEGPAVVPGWDVDDWAVAAASIVVDPAYAANVVDHVRRRGAVHTWDATAARTWTAIEASLARPRAALHEEEGGVRSTIAGQPASLSPAARPVHFANRVAGYLRRRFADGR